MPMIASARRGCQPLLLVVALLSLAAVGAAQTVVVEEGAAVKYLANSSDPGIAMGWTAEVYDDSGWSDGTFGLGYEDGGGAEQLITTTVPTDTLSIYARVHFNVTDTASVSALGLGCDYDDGYVAWLNGVEIYRSPSMPAGALDWDALPSLHESSNGTAPDYRPLADVTALGLPVLRDGDNVLAVGGWNDTGSSDMVLVPQLILNPSLEIARGPYLQMVTPSSIVIRWRTSTTTDSVVLHGAAPGSLTERTEDLAATTEHIVELTGLTPATQYFYSVGSTTATMAGGNLQHSFWTAPDPGTAQPIRIWAIGDAGTANGDQRDVRDAYLDATDCRRTDAWLQLGDNAYDDGTDSEYQDAVFDTYPSLLRAAVTWPTLGNHDARSASSASESGVYYDIFSLPRNAEAGGWPSGTEAYYSFDYGNIHFICLDSDDTDRDVGAAMYSWLETDIGDTTQDWVIAFWHHPPYSKGTHDSDTSNTATQMRERFVPILEDGGVDLVFSGHSHAYERTYLIDGHYGDSGSFDLSYLLDGGDGRRDGDGAYSKPGGGPAPRAGAVYTVAGSSGKTDDEGQLDHPAVFIGRHELASVILDVNGDRLDATVLDDRGSVLDYYSLRKSAAIPPDGPVGLAVSPVSATAISLTWTDINGEDGYRIERTVDGVAWLVAATVGANVTGHVDTGLSADTTYQYRLVAFNSTGPSMHSRCDSARTDSCGIAAVTAAATDVCAGDATVLSCGTPMPGLAYEWDFTDDGTYDATGCDAMHMYPGPGMYRARLRATDTAGGCAVDDAVDLEVLTNPALVAAIDPGCAGGDTDFLCGGAEPGATYQWDFEDDGSFDATGCDVASVVASGSHRARVRAIGGNGCVSEQTLDYTIAPDTAPTETGTLFVVKTSPLTMRFTWSPASGAATYRLARGTLASLFDHTVDDTLGIGACANPTTTLDDPDDIAAASDFYYVVAGVSPCGTVGDWGQGTPDPIPSPSCP